MIQNYQPTGAELRMLRVEAARVREQNADRRQRPLPRLTWTPPTVEPVDAERIAS